MKLPKLLRKVTYIAAVIVLTMIIFGPAVPLDAAILLAGSIISLAGMATNGTVRPSVLDLAKDRLKAVKAQLAGQLLD
jgi:hypothetical protein